METKPVAPLNKNLNSVKKQSPLANSSNRSSPEADRKRPKSDTSRLSRNVSKEIKTEEEEESSHSEASIGNFTNFLRLLTFSVRPITQRRTFDKLEASIYFFPQVLR